MRVDDGPCNCQPQAAPAASPVRARIAAVKPVKDMGKVLARDAPTGIPHFYSNRPLWKYTVWQAVPEDELDCATRWCILHRILEQVIE